MLNLKILALGVCQFVLHYKVQVNIIYFNSGTLYNKKVYIVVNAVRLYITNIKHDWGSSWS
jgi:hypothetical protein